AQEESGEHRRQLEKLLDELDGDTVPYDEIETLVRQKYGSSRPETVEELLHDQLDGEQTAYTFYDGVIAAIEDAETEFGVDRDRLLSVLRRIRAEEAEGAEEVNEVIESR
ncbi:MAG: ferritin-like domain-containing protein, partial [Halobacteriales archaeon]|nr:ferritin-like domain-containing protein [Halobacteriales archaeon]